MAYRFLANSPKISRFVILEGGACAVNRLTVPLCLEVPLGAPGPTSRPARTPVAGPSLSMVRWVAHPFCGSCREGGDFDSASSWVPHPFCGFCRKGGILTLPTSRRSIATREYEFYPMAHPSEVP